MGMLDVFRPSKPISLTDNFDYIDRDVDRFVSEMDRILAPMRGFSPNVYEFMPACDVEESEGAYRLYLDVPGLNKDDITVEVTGNRVTVGGERKHEHEEKGLNRYRMERRYGKFSRSFSLPEGVKKEGIEAGYDNGVLCVNVPKLEQSTAKKIAIKEGKTGFIAKLKGKEKS